MSAWPKIPTRTAGIGGPIRVRLLKRVKAHDGDICWGTWDAGTRIIRLDRGAKAEHQWRTFWHEWMHAALYDCGIQELLSDAGNEAMCQALSSAMVRHMRAQLRIPER